MEAGKEEEAAVRVVTLRAAEATPESFAPFGQVVSAGSDRAKFGPDDAQLDLSRGIPRFYIMRLENQPLRFSAITHHASVTQCLASIGGEDWHLAVAKPSLVDDGASSEQDGTKPVRSRAGHYYLPPDPAEVRVFRVSGPKFLKLHKGTWHAGPMFRADAMYFYNLELSNTNSAVELAPMEPGKEKVAVRVLKLRAVDATPESFAPFGQVVSGGSDGGKYGPDDAQLDLNRGIPRFYLMRLEKQPLKFSSITHHANVTQCLGSIGGQDWYLAVAKPSLVDGASELSGQETRDQDGTKPVQSRAGHYYLPPDPAEVCAFRVSGPKFLKLHKGTWHAGPLFRADAMDFYNLELSNTNIVDHTTHRFRKLDGVTFVVED